MKKLLLLCLTIGTCLPCMAQHSAGPFNRPDTARAVRFYRDSLQVTDAQARLLFKIEHEYRTGLWAAMRDSTATLADRQQKMKANQQKKLEALGKLLTTKQLEKLKHLGGQNTMPPEMRERWEKRRKDMEDHYRTRKQTEKLTPIN